MVALETAVVTHGLPRTPIDTPPRIVGDPGPAASEARRRCWGSADAPLDWTPSQPVNLGLARLVEATVRSAGGVPATVAVLDGELRIGLEGGELERLAGMTDASKCSIRELGRVMAAKGHGGTTVAGTLAAIRAANRRLGADGLPELRVFATGGIGGVHRNWGRTADISSDLLALGSTPVSVISAGAKVILDVPATREAFETHCVPVLGWLTDRFPLFTAPGLPDGPPLPRFDSMPALAAACRTHWEDLGRDEGILIANEIPEGMGLDPLELETLVHESVEAAESQGVSGAALTPFLLGRLAERSQGDALDANITLLCWNAAVGTALADALTTHG